MRDDRIFVGTTADTLTLPEEGSKWTRALYDALVDKLNALPAATKVAILEYTLEEVIPEEENWGRGDWFGTTKGEYNNVGCSLSRDGVKNGLEPSCFCLEGAVNFAAWKLGVIDYTVLTSAAPAEALLGKTWQWNDSSDRTFQEVVDVIRYGIETYTLADRPETV